MIEIAIKTHKNEEFIDITELIQREITKNCSQKCLLNIFIPHTTAAVTINENADPDVVRDMLMGFKTIVPQLEYHHMEGNSMAHIKSSLIGASLSVPVEKGKLCLGTWQNIYFCEFDGPRNRKAWISFY